MPFIFSKTQRWIINQMKYSKRSVCAKICHLIAANSPWELFLYPALANPYQIIMNTADMASQKKPAAFLSGVPPGWFALYTGGFCR